MANNELKHWKYIDRYKKNGEWIYVYPGEKATKNAFGRVRGGTNSLEAHKRLNREATNQVAKNTPSRNVPGANDQTSTSGKQMSAEQVARAKNKAAQYRQEKIDSHARALEAGERRSRQMGYSRNIPAEKSFNEKLQESNPNFKSVTKQTTQKQIRQGIRRAKIKTLQRDAAKAIERAKKWFEDLFD